MEKTNEKAGNGTDSLAETEDLGTNINSTGSEAVSDAVESAVADTVTTDDGLTVTSPVASSPATVAPPVTTWSGAATTLVATMLAVFKRAAAGIRIAFVRLWSPPWENEKTGGSLYGMLNIYADLVKLGFAVDLISFSDEKKTSAWQPDFKRLSWRDTKTLNTYDFAIFNTAGSFKDKEKGNDFEWAPILNALDVPFAVQIHDEAEPQYLTGRHLFFDHPRCVAYLPITTGIGERMVSAPGDRRVIIYPNFQTLEPLDPAPYYPRKIDQIVTTCRMTTRKRIRELVMQAKTLSDLGFRLDVHGASADWRYRKNLTEVNSGYWQFHGTFEREQLPEILIPAKFHYNVCSLKTQHFEPRLEISSAEAVAYGCTPILCANTVPEWVTADMAVLVDPDHMDDLAERLDEARDKAAHMNTRLVDAFNEANNPSRLFDLAETILAHVSEGERTTRPAAEASFGVPAPEPFALPLIKPADGTPAKGSSDGVTRAADKVDGGACAATTSGPGRAGSDDHAGNAETPSPDGLERPSGNSKFDYAKYDRRNTDFEGMLGGRKILSRIPVKKPERDWWVRVHPSVRCEPGVYEDKGAREFYIVEPDLYPLFGNKLVYRTLFLAVNSQGLVFWWPVNTDNNGRFNSWSYSALEAVQEAKKGWVRIEANMQAGAYDIFGPIGQIPDPEWPEEDVNQLLETAFRGKIIDNPDHPIILHLEGRLS